MNRLLILFALLISCKGQQKTEFIADYKMPGPQTIVYKTKKDYYNLVPVLLSDDKTEIISYPHLSPFTLASYIFNFITLSLDLPHLLNAPWTL